MSLPENIVALTNVIEDDVPILDEWAKSIHPGITVRWSEQRAAPPRMPGRGESIEEARARDPGPNHLTVEVTAKRTGLKMRQSIVLHRKMTTIGRMAAMAEKEVYLGEQQQIRKAHSLSDAVLLSGVSDRHLRRRDAALPICIRAVSELSPDDVVVAIAQLRRQGLPTSEPLYRAFTALPADKQREALTIAFGDPIQLTDALHDALDANDELCEAQTAIVAARKAVWDYPDDVAKHHDLVGTLCPESAPDEKYVRNEARIHELRQMIEADWKSNLFAAVMNAATLATQEEGAGRNQTVQIETAIERQRAAGVAAPRRRR